jgi:ubiquinone biosynthesis protein UbiJ
MMTRSRGRTSPTLLERLASVFDIRGEAAKALTERNQSLIDRSSLEAFMADRRAVHRDLEMSGNELTTLHISSRDILRAIKLRVTQAAQSGQ